MSLGTNQHARAADRDMRILILACACAYALLLVLAVGMRGLPERGVLQVVGVPALEHPFMDLRGVAAWCEAFRQGKDPAITPTRIMIPGSPDQPNFLMNYSPLVLGFGWLGMLPGGVISWGILMGVLFIWGVWFLAGPCRLRECCVWVLLLCSPDAVLAIERGNLDILVFVMLVAALEWRARPPVGAGLILAGALLKFFPIAALLAVWREKRVRAKLCAGIAAGLFLLFLCPIRSRILSIGGSLSGQCHSAFGCVVPADLLIHGGFPVEVAGIPLHALLRAGAVVMILVSLGVGYLLRRRDGVTDLSGRSVHGFFLGAPLIVLLFISGNQMDYKWIFLLFMVPSSLELMRGAGQPGAWIAKIWLFGVTVYSWWTFFSDEGSLRNMLLKQTVIWIVMMSGALLAGMLWKERKQA